MHEKKSGFSIELDETQLNEIEDVYNSNIEVFVRNQKYNNPVVHRRTL